VSDYIGFGKARVDVRMENESAGFWRVVPSGHDVCCDCDRIKPFDELEYVDTDDLECAIYRCQECVDALAA
jgi:hypothetical protein